MKKLFLFTFLFLTASFVSAENIVTTGKIKHNGLDANGNLETIHQDIRAGNASVSNFYFEVGEHHIEGTRFVHKFGRNPDIDKASGFEAIWNFGGDYTGFNAIGGEAIEVLSSNDADAGALVSSGTATGGTLTILINTAATFISDGVVVGDIILNDTDISHGVVTEVTGEIVLTVARFDKGGEFSSLPVAGDSYRIATPTSTGAAAVEIEFLLDSDFDNETSEYIILNGTTPVDSVGTDYIRNSRIEVLIAGSAGGNVGTITSRQATTTANIFDVMPIGYNETMVCAYTIPKEEEGHLLFWMPSLSGKKISAISGVRLMIRHRGEVFRVVEENAVIAAGSSALPRPYLIPKNKLPGGSDVMVMMDTDTDDTAGSCVMDFLLSAH
jgi:hypothetical protein